MGSVVLLIHGATSGPWLWDRDAALLEEAGFDVHRPSIDPRGDPLEQLEGWVEDRVAEGGGPPLLVGHGSAAAVAIRVAAQREVKALALVCPVPPGDVTLWPNLARLPALWRQLRANPQLQVPGVSMALRRLVERPELEGEAPSCPCLILHGFQDPLVGLYSSRLLADHLDAVLWRFDDLGHYPPLEEGGERLTHALASWLKAPRGREVVEIDPLGPEEGVGQPGRDARRPRRTRSNSRFGPRSIR